jgi:hypothetical protein
MVARIQPGSPQTKPTDHVVLELGNNVMYNFVNQINYFNE